MTMLETKSMDDLRIMLFGVSNQEMTVRELRTALFNAPGAAKQIEGKDFEMALCNLTRKNK